MIAAEANNATAHYNLGLALERQGQFDQAGRSFETALSLNQGLWQAHTGRGLCLLHLGQLEQALQHFDQALRSSPGQDRTLFGKAVALHQLGKLDEAAEIYRKLLPSNASSAELLVNLITLSMARKDDAKTKEYSDRMLKIRPQSRQALEGLSAVALSRGDFSGAVQHCSSAGQGRLRFVRSVVQPGPRLSENRPHGSGWKRLPRSRQASSRGSRGAMPIWASCSQERGDLAGARHACEAALAAAPDSPGLLWNLALLAEREGRAEEAERHFAKLVGLKPDWEDAAYRLGFLQIQRGDFAAAVDCFELCIKQRADWVEALLNLGLACWKFQDLDTATQTFERILSLQPQNPDALRALTAIAIERKDHNARLGSAPETERAGTSAPWSCPTTWASCCSPPENPKRPPNAIRWRRKRSPISRAALTNLGHALKAVRQGRRSSRRLEQGRRSGSRAGG